MGMRMTRLTLSDVQGRLREVKGVVQGVDAELGEIALEGAVEMEQYIATRGIVEGKAGRIESEDMINAVDFKKVASGATFSTWTFGWTDTFEKYFGYQESGFRHYLSGEAIPAMHALKDASDTARDRLKEVGGDIVTRAAHKFGR
jgi:hypothetical protein